MKIEATAVPFSRVLGAALLVTGSCIGAGMIGLPVVSAMAGLMPSTLAMFVCYLLTTAMGLLFLESTLWFSDKVGLLSIAHFAFGRIGQWFAGALFLFLLYSLSVAYLEGGGELLSYATFSFLGWSLPREAGVVLCSLLVATITYAGAAKVDHANRWLMGGLVVSYLILVSIGIPHIQPDHLSYANWSASIGTMPILLVCFGYQNLVPTLAHYLERNLSALRWAIVVGNVIPFFIYFSWNSVILGMLPDPNSEAFRNIVDSSAMVTHLLEGGGHGDQVLFLVRIFSCFAIATSVLPTMLSFVDFFKDGLKSFSLSPVATNGLTYSLVFLPPTICSILVPQLFLRALGFAGGIVDIVLFGMIPAAIVALGRYWKGVDASYRVKGGWPLLALVLLFSFCLFALNIAAWLF